MNKGITTSQLPPLKEPKHRPRTVVTTKDVQPPHPSYVDPAKRRKAGGPLITTGNIEQIQEANRKAAKGGGKGK